jgi:hypothetical protein
MITGHRRRALSSHVLVGKMGVILILVTLRFAADIP